MPRTSAKISAPPFPFVGAGEATYFEWAEVHVRFTRPPKPAERKLIAAKVPPPLRDSVDFEGRDLMVASGQTAHVDIHATYHRAGDPVEDDDDDDEEDDAEFAGRWFFASTAAVSRFNADIEAWLRHAHSIVPILFALRREDGESGGTELSDWHRASVKRAPQILAECEDVLASRDEDAPGAFAVRGVIEMALEARVAVPAEWRHWLSPGADAVAAMERGDGERLGAALAEAGGRGLAELAEAIEPDDARQLAALHAATEALLDADELPDEVARVLPLAAVDAMFADGATAATRARAKVLLERMSPARDEDSARADWLAYQAYRRAHQGRWREAIELAEFVLVRDDLDKSAYCNALYFVQDDNNKLGVDRERGPRFLAAALPHAPKNPAIYFNAACVYVELGERERALECVAEALKHGYDDAAKMQGEPLLRRALADDPRFDAIFAEDAARKKAAKAKKKAAKAKKKAAKKVPAKKTKKKAAKKKAAKAKKKVPAKKTKKEPAKKEPAQKEPAKKEPAKKEPAKKTKKKAAKERAAKRRG